MSAVIPITGRDCVGCAMCCKLPPIAALSKPEGVWCMHCPTHQSCAIHPDRPQACRTYFCYYMLSTLGEEWRPTKARFMVSILENNTLAVVSVDPSRADAWRREPYFTSFKNWATKIKVIVQVNRQMYAIFPNHIDDLGLVGTDEVIATFTTPEGRQYAEKRKAVAALPPTSN